MAKITKASDDVTNAVQEVIDKMGLTLYVRFSALHVSGQKQLVKVAKVSPTTEYFNQKPDNIIVYVNEEIYDMLEQKQRMMLIANALYGISYDDEKDKLNVIQPELGISLGGYQQYGSDLVDAAEAVQLALQQLKERQEEEKNAKKKKKPND